MYSTITANIGLHPNLQIGISDTITQDCISPGLSRTTSTGIYPSLCCLILASTTEPGSSSSASPTSPASLAVSTAPTAIPAVAPVPVTMSKTLKERRRTNSLFGKGPFRFIVSSRRKRSQCSLDIQLSLSRKSSISSGTNSVSSEPISPKTAVFPSPEPRKRGSLQTEVLCESERGFPFDKPISKPVSTRGRDIDSVSSDFPSSYSTGLKAHPGTPVEFSSNSEPCLSSPIDFKPRSESSSSSSSESCSVSSLGNGRSAGQDYHRYLRDISSAKSKAKETRREESTHGYFYNGESDEIVEVPIYSSSEGKQRLENIDYKERKAKRRARSLEVQAQMLREGSCARLALDSSRHSIEARKGSAQSSRCSNDSTELVLNQIRRSFERRKNSGGKESSYNIFKDEVEKGFLDGSL